MKRLTLEGQCDKGRWMRAAQCCVVNIPIIISGDTITLATQPPRPRRRCFNNLGGDHHLTEDRRGTGVLGASLVNIAHNQDI